MLTNNNNNDSNNFVSLEGHFEVTVLEAKDLYNTQLLSTQDPYCKVECDQESFKTKVHTDGGKQAKWNQTFLFNLSGANTNQDMIHFKVKHKGTLSDTKIGRSDYKIVDLIKKQKESNGPFWIGIVDY